MSSQYLETQTCVGVKDALPRTSSNLVTTPRTCRANRLFHDWHSRGYDINIGIVTNHNTTICGVTWCPTKRQQLSALEGTQEAGCVVCLTVWCWMDVSDSHQCTKNLLLALCWGWVQHQPSTQCQGYSSHVAQHVDSMHDPFACD